MTRQYDNILQTIGHTPTVRINRLAPPNVPVPFSPPLEDAYLPQVDDIVQAVQKLSKW